MAHVNPTISEASVVKDFIAKALALKYFYIALLSLFLIRAYLVNKYSPTEYQVKTVIGPMEDTRNSVLGSPQLFPGFSAMEDERNLENDVNNLKSFTLISSTINNLNLEIGYFTEMKKIFKQKRQVYPATPYTVNIDKSHIQPIYLQFYIDILDNSSYRLTASGDDVSVYNFIDNAVVSVGNIFRIDTICKFNETIVNPRFKFSVNLNSGYNKSSKNADQLSYFEFYHLDYLTMDYLGRLKVEPVNLKSSLINVFFSGQNLYLSIDFLNKYIQNYLDENLSKKNKISINAISFIDGQLSDISDSLSQSENQLKDYRSANQVMDLSYQGQRAFEQMSQIDNDKTNLQMQEKYYKYILEYFNENKDMAGLAPPSATNVADPILNELIMQLLELNAQRSNILSNNNEKNLFLGQIDNRISMQKQAIIENVTNNLNTLNLSLNELNYRSDKVSREISRMPRTELNMSSIQRRFNLDDAIYTYLLQKRSEQAIAMASNYPDYEILEPARSVSRSILSPNKTLNWAMALFLGLLIPTAFIIVRNFFNEKITGIHEAESLYDHPVLATIYNNPHKSEDVVSELPGSSISESFRNLRSRLFLKYKAYKEKIILITSSQPEDGKSFISYNLAVSIASVGYKTIILDCDLRRPKLHEKFNQNNSSGITTFMTDHTPVNEIIRQTDFENLSYIPAGPMIPNSSEMIESGKLDELFDMVKSKYDYIIMDTTPAGIVADASLMLKYSNINLLVVRNNYTRKDILTEVLKFFQSNNVDNLDIIYNDLSLSDSKYGQYTSYYKSMKK